jgi:hypothetical protein
MEVGDRQHDVTSSSKKRARALNDVAEEVEWNNDYEFGEGSRPQANRAAHVRRTSMRGGTGSRDRGRGRGRGVRQIDTPEITPFELQRLHQILQNAALMQQQLGDLRGLVNPLNPHFANTNMGGIV